jgi:hypothetical protein
MEQERQTLMGAFQRTHGSPQSIRQTMTMMAPKMKQHLESMGSQSDVEEGTGTPDDAGSVSASSGSTNGVHFEEGFLSY